MADVFSFDSERLDAEIRKLDRSSPTGVDEAGKPFWSVRTKLWAMIPSDSLTKRSKDPIDPILIPIPIAAQVSISDLSVEHVEVEARSLGMSQTFSRPKIEGVASSTSRDWYGTDMSVRCLEGMKAQMERGVPIVPAHRKGGMFGEPMEWDDIIGKTVGARIESRNVAAPVDGEAGYVLLSINELYPEEEKALKLLQRIDREEPIGQSIGGWFVELRVMTDDEGEVNRVVVEEVELDHLAITRMPANPDATGLVALRSKLAEHFRASAPAPVSIPEPETIAEEVRTIDTSGETNTLAVTEPSQLDATSAALHDGIDPVDAIQRAAPEPEPSVIPAETSTPISEGERAMPTENETPSTMDVMLEELRAMNGRIVAMEARAVAAPVAAPVAAQPTELEIVRAQLADANRKLEAQASEPMRRGIHSNGVSYHVENSAVGALGLKDLCSRAKSGTSGRSAPTLAEVVEASATFLTGDARAKLGKIERSELEAVLRNVMVAGEIDGLIENPFNRGSQWS